MVKYQNQIGQVCRYSIDDIDEYTIDELIDKGKRFIIIDSEEEESNEDN